jgi:hypothetical protein
MQATPPSFRDWHAPSPDEVGEDIVTFVKQLGQPTWITIPGEDESRSRAIVTLLHGNEPSGLKAVHNILRHQVRPATNLGILIASVNAALHEPLFSHRFIPGEKDLNRCFSPPYRTDQEKLAGAILDRLAEFAPEAIIDTHNTSGHSDPFAVAAIDDAATHQLAQMFTRRLVVLDLELGTLTEQYGRVGPVVTVEFGGFMDPRADEMAIETMANFVTRHQLFDVESLPMMTLRHPHRLEIKDTAELRYSSSVEEEADLTIFNTIDQLNFSRVEKGTSLGWTGRNGLSGVTCISADGEDLLQDYFIEENGFLVTNQPITLFMATTDPYIAKKDCLLYLTPA